VAQYSDAAAVELAEQVLAVARAVDPSGDSRLHGVWHPLVHRHVLSECPNVELDCSIPLFKPLVAKRYLFGCHVKTVGHRNVMKFLIPAEHRQAHLLFPKLVGKI
jgi:hypothetical protein